MTKLNVDPKLIETLAALLERTGLSEIELAEGDHRVRVVRPVLAASTHAVSPPAAGEAMPARVPEAPPEGTVTSPMVGTAYLAPEPGAEPFVAVGTRVEAGQTLLIVEAMKVMNPIRAPRAGTIKQVFVANAAPVEFGEALLVIG